MIQSIFPIPLGFYELEKPLNKSEHKYFSSLELHRNQGNFCSVDRQILENKKMNRLKKFFINSLKDYASDTYDFKNDVELYITQSWINLSEPKDYHHQHSHPNSILSGVFYIDVDDEKDKINFFQNSINDLFRGNAFSFEHSNFNDFNSQTWWMPSITGRLYIFPSGLPHDVSPNKDRTKNRTSLSFNTFVKGTLGKNNNSTELII
jgi:uncharacterized protein (TIGR02466 family)